MMIYCPNYHTKCPIIRAMDKIVCIAQSCGESGDLIHNQLGQLTIYHSHPPIPYSHSIPYVRCQMT
eukprot:9449068-Ditylum_brightwellii.AAC.1